MSAGLSNTWSAQSANDDTDDDYFAFTDPGDTEVSQPANDTTNKCDLEVLQFLDDSKRDVAVLNSYLLMKKLFMQHNVVLPSSAAVERLFSFAGMITHPHRRSMSDETLEQLLLLKANEWTFTVKLTLPFNFILTHIFKCEGLLYYTSSCKWCFNWHLWHVICNLM